MLAPHLNDEDAEKSEKIEWCENVLGNNIECSSLAPHGTWHVCKHDVEQSLNTYGGRSRRVPQTTTTVVLYKLAHDRTCGGRLSSSTNN